MAHREMVVHHSLALFLRQQIPFARFEEWIHDKVLGFAGLEARAGSLLAGVRVVAHILGAARHRKV